jgi:hypothetical protein
VRVIADRNLNLHSKSTEGGLVHLPKRVAKIVPDDVEDHPMFGRLKKYGVIAVLKDRAEIEVTEESVEEKLDELEDEGLLDKEEKEKEE